MYEGVSKSGEILSLADVEDMPHLVMRDRVTATGSDLGFCQIRLHMDAQLSQVNRPS